MAESEEYIWHKLHVYIKLPGTDFFFQNLHGGIDFLKNSSAILQQFSENIFIAAPDKV